LPSDATFLMIRAWGSALLVGALCLLAVAARAQTVPQPLRPDIQVRHVLSTATGSPSVRLVRDPRNNTLYYLKRNGSLFRVNLAAATSTLIATTTQHGLRNAQGLAIGPNGTIYLVGNEDVPQARTRGTVMKGVLQSGGSRAWSPVARTEPYPKSNTAFDHRLSGILVTNAGDFLLVNSGSRTDHGEVQSAGGLFPDTREVGLTACILRIPTNASNLELRNDRAWLKAGGYIFAEGIRNTYDMAYAPNGDLIGTENGPDRDMSEELNFLRPGLHYGFPWRIGGQANPQQFPDYDPGQDKLLDARFVGVERGYYHNDPGFPPRPAVTLIEPITNAGPAADSFRDPANGVIKDASALGRSLRTFTSHRTPVGLVFDRAGALGPEFRGDGFMLSWNRGDPDGDDVAGPFKDAGQDLLHLQLTKSGSTYRLQATRIVGDFNNPIDAVLIANRLYVLDYGGTQSIWEVTLPAA
jgi:glucose/arabinose dehydrogenase